jgi:hypothetical protein
MAKDVVEFLNWSAEPEMDERKKMGVKAPFSLSHFPTQKKALLQHLTAGADRGAVHDLASLELRMSSSS